MSGIDADVLRAQIDVLEDAVSLHRESVQEAEEIELVALTTEQQAHDVAAEAQQAQVDHRSAIHSLSHDIDEIRDVLATIPDPRRPA